MPPSVPFWKLKKRKKTIAEELGVTEEDKKNRVEPPASGIMPPYINMGKGIVTAIPGPGPRKRKKVFVHQPAEGIGTRASGIDFFTDEHGTMRKKTAKPPKQASPPTIKEIKRRLKKA